MSTHYQILIIGAGTAGLMTAAQLKKQKPELSVGIIDPAEKHYYQPAFTLVGADTFDFEKTYRPMKSVIPNGVTWIKEYADQFIPEENKVIDKNGKEYTYDFLVVCPGLIMDLSLIEGLEEALGKGVVCSNYTDPEHTKHVLKNFKGGNAIFTQPTTPIKCGGAPQKAAYMSAHYFQKNNLSDKTNVVYATPGSVIFGVPEIAKTLNKVLDRYDIHFKPYYAPVKIDAEKGLVTFKNTNPEKNEVVIESGNILDEKPVEENTYTMPFDMLHLAPPQRAPDFIKNSPFALETGWMKVDQYSMQSPDYKNVFGLGDVCGLPTAKTGAAVRKQVPVAIANILKLMEAGKITDKKYDGYSSCPLVTGYGKMVLAEFDYSNKFIPDPKLKQLLVFDSSKESWNLWMLKKYILPYLYWNKMLKGVDV